jgi:hypothetical protein
VLVGQQFGDHRRLPHQELRATPRHEHAWTHRHAFPAEIRPSDDVFQGQSLDALLHHAAEFVRMRGGIDEDLRLVLGEYAACGTQGGGNLGSPGHGGHASQGVPKILFCWLGYKAWEH